MVPHIWFWMQDNPKIFLAKEDLIILRLLYYQSRKEMISQKRFNIPYQNIYLRFDPDLLEGYQALEVFEWFTPAIESPQIKFPPDLNLFIQTGIPTNFENAKEGSPNPVYIGIPWSFCVFTFEKNLPIEEIKNELKCKIYQYRFKVYQ